MILHTTLKTVPDLTQVTGEGLVTLRVVYESEDTVRCRAPRYVFLMAERFEHLIAVVFR